MNGPGLRTAARLCRYVFVSLFFLTFTDVLIAASIPSGWQVTGYGRGVLVTNAVVEYDAGTWNLKTGPARSAVVCKSLNGDISVTMKIIDASGQPQAHIGIMTWSSLSLNAGKAGLVLDPQGQKLYFTWDEASDYPQIFSSYVQAEGLGFPVWLRVTRSGNTFTGYYSKDGREWRQVGVPVKTFWAGKRPEIYAGVYADGICEHRFSDLEAVAKSIPAPQPLPDDWSTTVQGQPEFVGEAKVANGKWTLAGASTHQRGGFHNVTAMRVVTPKTQLTAKIRLADLADPRAGGGLLLNAHGMDVGILAFPSGNKISFFTRQTESGRFLSYKNIPLPAALVGQAEAYLRLAIVDAKAAAFYSTTTNDWTQVGDIMTVNELTADVAGGMEFYNDSGSRVVTSASFEDFDSQAITTLPIKGAPVPVVAAAPRPAPTVAPAPVAQAQPAPAPRPNYTTSYPKPSRSIGDALGGFLCIGIIVLIIVTVVFIKPFNRLVYLRNRARKAWAQIDVQLKRRHDLILNYVEAVKGYAKHERGTLESVAQARTVAANATTVGDRAKAEAALNVTMHSLQAVVEAYPDLKADKQFLSLQNNLKDTEDKLANARLEYNEEVMTYNTQVQSFPTNIIAFVFRFKERDFFEVTEADQREAPRATT